MPRQTRPPASPAPTLPPASAPGLTDDQVNRWADLIADGRDAFPEGLPAPDHERFLAAVRERLRGRLVRLIARAIAARLYRRARPGTEDPDHAGA
jgi:hypothetical protein